MKPGGRETTEEGSQISDTFQSLYIKFYIFIYIKFYNLLHIYYRN